MFVVAIGTALVVGTTLNYIIEPRGKHHLQHQSSLQIQTARWYLLVTGLVLAVIAIIITAVAYYLHSLLPDGDASVNNIHPIHSLKSLHLFY